MAGQDLHISTATEPQQKVGLTVEMEAAALMAVAHFRGRREHSQIFRGVFKFFTGIKGNGQQAHFLAVMNIRWDMLLLGFLHGMLLNQNRME